MALSQFQSARRATREYLLHHEIKNHMFHGPISDRYWHEPYRVVAINMESYGYDGHCDVNRETLTDWLYDAGHTRTRTTRFTTVILALVLERLTQTKHPLQERCRAAYSDKNLLEETLDRTTYYNIRPESNPNKTQDFTAIAAVGATDLGALLWAEILALDPNVVIVSGQAGLAAVNGLAGMSPALPFRGQAVNRFGFLVQSIAHPSRPNYATWCSMIDDIGDWFDKRKQKGVAS